METQRNMYSLSSKDRNSAEPSVSAVEDDSHLTAVHNELRDINTCNVIYYRALALHTAVETGNRPSSTWVPECKEDGTYESIQCRGSNKMCWCVDAAGNEVSD